MKEVLPGRALKVVAACWVFSLVMFGAGPLSAQSSPLAPNSLDGGRFVGSARVGDESTRVLRAGLSLGYAHTESVLGERDRHERVFSDVSGALTLVPWFQVALHLDGRYDLHRSPALGRDKGFAGSSAVMTRHAFALRPDLSIAGQARFLFPAANAVKLGFSGITTELSGLMSYTAWKGGELSGLLGYRFDRTSRALSDSDALSPADRLAAQVSHFNAFMIGAMVSSQLKHATLLGEWSWDIQHGSGSPAAIESPMRLRAAVQSLIGERIVPGAEFGVTLSQRPIFNNLFRIEPRVWAAVTLGVLLGKTPEKIPEEAPLQAAPVVEKRAATGELVVHANDGETPLHGAAVTVTMGEETLSSETDATGQASFRVNRGEPITVTVTAGGCHPATQTTVVETPSHPITISLKRALPEGEIKGKVRSLRGGPLKARVEVLDTGRIVQTKDDGTFLIEVPPGDYRLRISADGHEAQERTAQVERLGVTILVVDLRRTSK